MKESPNLDLLRTIAVSLVVISHLAPFIDGMAAAFNYKTFGRVGVALFFVHTTLVLMLSLQRHGSAWGPFMVRRVFRIYPLSVVAVLSVALFAVAAGRPLTTGDIVSNLLLVQNLTGNDSWPDPLWTLPFEMQMYVVLPALFVFAQAGRSLKRAVAVYAVALTVAGISRAAGFHTLLIAFLPCFLPGLLAFTLMQRVRPTLHPAVLFAVVGAGAVLAPLAVSAGAGDLPTFWVLCVLVGVLIPFSRDIESRPLAAFSHWIAERSYGIYLTHMFATAITMPGAYPVPVKLALYFLCLGGMAVIAHRLIERPGMRLGARLASRLAARPSSDRSRQTAPA